MLERSLHQERAPVLTVISLLLTLAIWALMLVLGLGDFALVRMFATVVLLAIGVLLNGLAGVLASSREEHRGLEVAVGGMLLWLVTAAVLASHGPYW